MKAYPVKFEVRDGADGWRLFALPCHGLGWAPIPMTPPRGTPGGALVEFASALYAVATNGDQPLPAVPSKPAASSSHDNLGAGTEQTEKPNEDALIESICKRVGQCDLFGTHGEKVLRRRLAAAFPSVGTTAPASLSADSEALAESCGELAPVARELLYRMRAEKEAEEKRQTAQAEPPEIAAALEDLQFARGSHLAWAEHLEAHVASGEPCAECAEKPYKMNAAHEREWVAKYDRIIAIVRAADGRSSAPAPQPRLGDTR